jgi:hypothetical protein
MDGHFRRRFVRQPTIFETPCLWSKRLAREGSAEVIVTSLAFLVTNSV